MCGGAAAEGLTHLMHLTGYSGLCPLPPAGDAGALEPMHAREIEAVAVVLDPVCGEKLRQVCAYAHAWVVDTPVNRQAAEVLCRSSLPMNIRR